MNERIAQYRDKASQYWNSFSKKQKVLFISTFLFLILAAVVLTMQLSKTEYEVAFTDLNASDSAGVINYLDSSSIPYKLSADGKTISVPSTDVAIAKVNIGSQGIIQNGSLGYKSFEESSSPIGMTDKEFDVKYNNALNGEVEQLLQRMQGIQDAKVLVNMPKDNIFAGLEEQDKASASVALQFKPGYHPNQAAVDGYFNLVKTAIPNLPIENITITNTDEAELIPTARGGSGGLSTEVQENMALQKKFENDVRNNVKQFLSQIVGDENVNVLVASKLNFDKETRKENLVTPVDVDNMKGIEISVQEIQKSYTGASNPTGGVAGTGQEEVPGYPSSDAAGNSSSEETSSTKNYDVNRIVKDIVSSPYTVKDLTINVAVEPPAGETELQAPVQDAIQNILVNIVRASLADSGTVTSDADLAKKVSVISQGFQTAAATNTGFQLSTGMMWGAGALVAALIAAVVILLVRRRRKQNEIEEEEIPLPVATEFPSITLDSVTNESQVRKQLESLAKKKPDEFVNLLRTWLADE
ncbi:flagellar basal-body MS-ring/collar protein FliF [Paenibacillus pabuli]|uniref:flagellar basal-body MS-ring/collar protein FliF n=1 Tax=Paenibacillus pabuli TaxID=1472 RepID=UPI000781C7AB|nr:flagellar basal-body MS-ring/collar protein FliF [Paenibacillus pabuli]MEC0123883.1 flagellar basal-body MS-ring/collar protein FliF [Paenibacillus pabuli]